MPDIALTDEQFSRLANVAQTAMSQAWERDPYADRTTIAEPVFDEIFGNACNASEYADNPATDLSDAVWHGVASAPVPSVKCDGSGVVITNNGYEPCGIDCTECLDD